MDMNQDQKLTRKEISLLLFAFGNLLLSIHFLVDAIL